MNPLRMLLPSAALLLLAAGPATSAYAQFTLVSTSPAQGTAGVSTDAVVELVFSEPIDTTAAYDLAYGFFLSIEAYPEIGPPLSIELADGGRTLRMHFILEPDTQYWAVLWTAQSTSGEPLARSEAFTFSTAATLPTASVSGTISSSEIEVVNTVVALFPADDPFGDSPPGGYAVVHDEGGGYTIDHVAPGVYIAFALKDLDFDGSPSAPGEGFSAYDQDSDRIGDLVVVGEGEIVEGIDIDMVEIAPITAREAVSDAASYAEELLGSVHLAAVESGLMSADGRSDLWSYTFYSPTTEESVAIVSLAGMLIPLSIEAGGFDLTVPLPDDWIDSEEALAITQEMGGATFLEENPDAGVTAFLYSFEGPLFEAGKRGSLLLGRPFRRVTFDSRGVAGKAGAPRPQWVVWYLATDDISIYALDASTGEVISTVGVPSSAQFSYSGALEAAAAWSSDAVLVHVGVAEGADLDEFGRSDFWEYTFYDPLSEMVRVFYTASGSVFLDEERDVSQLASLIALPESWIDSEAASEQAEAKSGDFRALHVDAVISAVLSYGLRSNAPERLVWRFTFWSPEDDVSLEVDVDAVSGLAITGADRLGELPGALRLHQNYPNPFNGSTVFTYELPTAGPARVAVYDAIGRLAAVLVEGNQSAGTHRVRWTPAGAASGIYVARIEMGASRRAVTVMYVK